MPKLKPGQGATWHRYGCHLRIYDNGGKTADRYTILPPKWAGEDWHYSRSPSAPRWQAIASDRDPFHPQGYGQHCGADAGPHLGKRISWDDLPPKVQQFARQTFGTAWVPPLNAQE